MFHKLLGTSCECTIRRNVVSPNRSLTLSTRKRGSQLLCMRKMRQLIESVDGATADRSWLPSAFRLFAMDGILVECNFPWDLHFTKRSTKRRTKCWIFHLQDRKNSSLKWVWI